MIKKIVIEMDLDTRAALMKPIKGHGGFQSFIRRLQKQVRGKRIALTPEDMLRMHRYSVAQKKGGYQYRMGMLLDEIERFSDIWMQMYAESR